MPKATNSDEPGNEVAKKMFAADELRGIQSFEDAMRLMEDAGIDIEDAADAIGDGFVLLDNKSQLEDIPLVFLTWSQSTGDQGDYTVARVVAKMPNGTVGKFVVVDGSSTGIHFQLNEYSKSHGGKVGGLTAFGGLRVSDYKVEVDGKMQDATTVYINTAKK